MTNEVVVKNVILKNHEGEYLLPYTGATQGADGIPTDICKNLRIKTTGTNVQLNWKDPDDTVVEGQVLATWGKTIIVRKEGSIPVSPNDGVVIKTSTIRNEHDSVALVDTLPDTTNEYFYKAFPVSINGVVNLDPSGVFGSAEIYEFSINQSNSNPKGSVKYHGRNANYKPAFMNFAEDQFDYGDWEDAFFMHLFKPCMLKHNGTVDYFLNKNNYAQKEDGTPSDVADQNYDGEAMVQIGQVWIKEWEEGGLIHVRIANKKVDDSYDCFTHYNKNNELQEFVYRAIYDGSNVSNHIRSLSGKAICKTVAGNTQRAYCQANGEGWDCDEYSLRRMINYLLILIGKSLDTQTTFGTGRYSGGSSNNNNQLNTGTLDSNGMFYGDNNNGAVKVFGIENWWGNIWKLTCGVVQKQGKMLYKLTPGTIDGSSATDYNADGTGYIDSGVTNTGTITQQHLRNMKLVPRLGLIPTNTTGGSTSTFYCDSWWNNSTVIGFARFGCPPADGLSVGAFAFSVGGVLSGSAWRYGVALSYKAS